MTLVMQGVRVLEVAQHTFVPAAGAVLADWGADVIKIEHPVRGDVMRGFLNVTGVPANPLRHALIEHPNRGKRSVGLDVATAEGQELLYELAKTCDVFLTNYLPAQRQKYKFDIEHIRAANPNIIYARGSAFGDKGPEREKGGFDATAFWTRGGLAHVNTPEGLDGVFTQPVAAFGDTIGGMNIAGGISAALFHRERTGHAAEIDVSLLSSSWWASGAAIDIGIETGIVPRAKMPFSGSMTGAPFVGNFICSDGGVINISTFTPGPYIRDLFKHLDIPDAADDPRFSDALTLMQNWQAASDLVRDAIATKPFAYWREHLRTYSGQWAPAQSLIDLASDEQALANDMLIEVEALDGGAPMKLVRNPVQFDHEPVHTTRGPQPWEHTEVVLMEIGVEWERIEQLKAAGTIS
jgi:crotonobetainyl-CoA:carnitine CoA-transferase CaiB-like acyl-CoA transferase